METANRTGDFMHTPRFEAVTWDRKAPSASSAKEERSKSEFRRQLNMDDNGPANIEHPTFNLERRMENGLRDVRWTRPAAGEGFCSFQPRDR
jgi:hypothetical protein